jgi:small-conductance mechanosensitive channel
MSLQADVGADPGFAMWASGWMQEPILTLGNTSLSIASIIKLVVVCALLAVAGRLLRRTLARRVFPRAHIDQETGRALASVIMYAFFVLGTLVGFQAVGIDLSTLTVLFGALGVGIGFGLQTIAANFIAGIIILFERPIRIGDRIQLGDLHGRVVRIRARATEVVTNDGIAVIVPNSEFISSRVVNWSHGDDKIRVRVPVGVAYGSDVNQVRAALLEAAASVGATLPEPAPKVRLKGFGPSSLDFELLGWTTELLQARGEFQSRLNLAIHESLRQHAIQIPFPQRDVHVRLPEGIPLSKEAV